MSRTHEVSRSTGTRSIDELVGGGVQQRQLILLEGPAFTGKDVIVRLFSLAGLRAGEAALFVLTDRSASEVRASLMAMDGSWEEYEHAGLVEFVDAYSRLIGADGKCPNTQFLDDALDLNTMGNAAAAAQKRLMKRSQNVRVIFDSISTLLAFNNETAALRNLHLILGRARQAGATILVVMQQGMHSEHVLQAIKNLADGIIELRDDGLKHVLRAEGKGFVDGVGWIEYRFNPTSLEVIGGLAGGRIR